MSHTSSPEIFPRQCCPTQRISASWDCEKFVSENCTKILVTFIVVEYESPFEFPLRNGWTCAGYKWDEYEPSLQKKRKPFLRLRWTGIWDVESAFGTIWEGKFQIQTAAFHSLWWTNSEQILNEHDWEVSLHDHPYVAYFIIFPEWFPGRLLLSKEV